MINRHEVNERTMLYQNLHDQVLQSYLHHLGLHDQLSPPNNLATDELVLRLEADLQLFSKIRNTCYLNP